MNKVIKIKIDRYGNSKIETEGFVGTDCLEATKRLEVALGEKTSDDPTPEMYDGSCGVDICGGSPS